MNLLERRAAKAVQHHVKHLDSPDAGANQRVSRAVGEAFVAAQTLNSIGTIPAVLSKPELDAVTSLLILVSPEYTYEPMMTDNTPSIY